MKNIDINSNKKNQTIGEFKNYCANKLLILISLIFVITILVNCDSSNDQSDNTPSTMVSNLTSSSDSTSITLTWTNPTDINFSHLEIYYGIGSADEKFTGIINNEGTKIKDLKTNTKYTVLIKTIDLEGNLSNSKTITVATTIVKISGAIKVINSWGIGDHWENKPDGHYWITYDSLLSLQPSVCFYENNFDSVYEPRMLAVFQVDHPYRDQAIIYVKVGTPENIIAEKRFQSYRAGAQPFEDSSGNLITMVMDISELIPKIHGTNSENDVFLQIRNYRNTEGEVKSFSIEYYSDYSKDPFKTIEGETGSFATGSSNFIANTANALTTEEKASITPLLRSAILYKPVFITEHPPEAELQQDMKKNGVYKEGKNYNKVFSGYGTGLAPPTEEQWQSIKKLRDIKLSIYNLTPLESVDLSATKWFPPIGNQGPEGSCMAFSIGYYIHTYNEAKENNWDLSDATWEGGDHGQPSVKYQDKIMSPDFFYHQINGGGDGGSTSDDAIGIAIRIGGASWAKMPNNVDDHTSWPKEEAFRQAAKRRGRTPETFDSYGYFILKSEEDINLLNDILSTGYCVSISIKAGGVDEKDHLYSLLDTNDVISNYTGDTMIANHANTIVGYKKGSAWDAANPDN